jgi:hypothetical protein
MTVDFLDWNISTIKKNIRFVSKGSKGVGVETNKEKPMKSIVL